MSHNQPFPRQSKVALFLPLDQDSTPLTWLNSPDLLRDRYATSEANEVVIGTPSSGLYAIVTSGCQDVGAILYLFCPTVSTSSEAMLVTLKPTFHIGSVLQITDHVPMNQWVSNSCSSGAEEPGACTTTGSIAYVSVSCELLVGLFESRSGLFMTR